MKRDKRGYRTFGECLRAMRAERRITLREFCKRAGADPGNVSRIERGIWPPPQDEEILGRFAGALGIRKGSDDWYTLSDLAAADCGIVPKDLLDDEEVVAALPAFFRTLRGQKPTTEERRTLVQKLRLT